MPLVRIILRNADHSSTETERFTNTFLWSGKSLPASTLPTGIEMSVGVINAIPGSPYRLSIFTSSRLRRVNNLGFTRCFGFLNLSINAFHILLSQVSKNKKATTPQIPATLDTKNKGRKSHRVAAYIAGTPTTNFTMHNKKIGISLKSIGARFSDRKPDHLHHQVPARCTTLP